MTYFNVLQHLKEYKIDRIPLSDFKETWETQGTAATTVSTTNNTVHTNSLKIESLADDNYIYTVFDEPLKLNDREYAVLHLYSDALISEGDLKLVLSDSKTLISETLTLELPALTANTMNICELTITEDQASKLSAIQSVGLKATTDLSTATFYLARIDLTNTNYITSVEEVNDFITKGTNFVLSKIGETTLPENEGLQDAVYLAAASMLWMKQNENEVQNWDYGSRTYTRNYGKSLERRAKDLCDEYLLGQDVDVGESGNSSKPLNVIGGPSSLNL